MKKLLLLFTAFLAVFSAFAADVTISWTGASSWTTVSNDVLTYTQGGYTVTLSKNDGSTNPAVPAANDARVYAKGSVKVSTTGGNMKKMVFAVSTKGKFRQAEITASTGDVVVDNTAWTVTWTGDAKEVTLTVGEKAVYGTDGESKGGQFDFDNIVVTADGDGGVDPTPDPEPGVEAVTIFSEPFSADLGDFTVDTKTEGLSYDVWQWSSQYKCAIAKSYVSGTRYASESWLVSPVVDLTKATDCALSFDNAGNYFTTAENFAAAVSVKIREEGGEWVTLYCNNPATGTSFTFSNATADISEFDGKKVQIAFVYTSTEELAGTYEVKNVLIKGVTSETPDFVEAPVFSPAAGTYAGSVTVTLTAAEGTSIYYTTDGTAVTTETGTLYTGPFVVSTTCDVRAIAVRADGLESAESSSTYTIKNAPEISDKQVLYYFTGNKWGFPVSTSESTVELTSPIVEGNVSLDFTSGSTATRMWEDFNAGLQFRIYNGGTITLSTTDDANIVGIEFNTSKKSLAPASGEIDANGVWTGTAAKSVAFDVTGTTNINYIIVTLDKTSGIDGVSAKGAETVKAIYSLDGRKLQQLAKGINIVNGKKVLVK